MEFPAPPGGSSGSRQIIGPKMSFVDKVLKSATTDPTWITIEVILLLYWMRKK